MSQHSAWVKARSGNRGRKGVEVHEGLMKERVERPERDQVGAVEGG